MKLIFRILLRRIGMQVLPMILQFVVDLLARWMYTGINLEPKEIPVVKKQVFEICRCSQKVTTIWSQLEDKIKA